MENEKEVIRELRLGYEDRGRIIGMILKFLNNQLPRHPYTKLLDQYKDMEPYQLLMALQHHPIFVSQKPKPISKERLRQIREDLSMTQTDFAAYVGNVSMRAVQEWESGKRSIPSTVIEILRLNGNL